MPQTETIRELTASELDEVSGGLSVTAHVGVNASDVTGAVSGLVGQVGGLVSGLLGTVLGAVGGLTSAL
ncbi:MAG TPA: hypothetical protein VKV77_10620 [Methylovirgula sp.]|nr:hypothetical protein [Methylovirgula sp.]